MNFDNEAQPKYEKQKPKTSPMYKKYEPEVRAPEDKKKALETMSKAIHTEEFKKFVALVGQDVAREFFKTTLLNTSRED